MSGKEQEKKPEKQLDPIYPNAEIRKTATSLKICKETFQELGLKGFLEAINETYLDNKGKVEGPHESIQIELDSEAIPEIQPSSLALTETSPCVDVFLEWETQGETELAHHISVALFRIGKDIHSSYTLKLSASVKNEKPQGLVVGARIERTVRLVGIVFPSHSSLIDDALLTFTTELIDVGIIK
jgi:hypothetical protein